MEEHNTATITDDVDLLLEFEKLEQERLRLLQSSIETIAVKEDIQEVVVIDDTIQRYENLIFYYPLDNMNLEIDVSAFENDIFRIRFSNIDIYFQHRDGKLKPHGIKATKVVAETFEVLKKVYDDYVSNTFDVIKTILSIYFIESDYSIIYSQALSELQIAIRFKDITIKNDSKQSHLIKDIIYTLVIKRNSNYSLTTPFQCFIFGSRPIVSLAEYNSNYTHSHFASGSTGRQNICLGSGIMNNILPNISNGLFNPNKDGFSSTFASYVTAAESMAKYEDLNGGPYKRIENIRLSNNNRIDYDGITYQYSLYLKDRLNSSNVFDYIVEHKYIKPIQIKYYGKREFKFAVNLPSDFKTKFEISKVLLDNAGRILKIVENSNSTTNSSATENNNVVRTESLDNKIFWKNTVISRYQIVGSNEQLEEDISKATYPKWIDKFIYFYLNEIINRVLNDKSL